MLLVKKISWTPLETKPPPSMAFSLREYSEGQQPDVHVKLWNATIS